MAFDSRQYEWADLSLILGGRDVTGIRGLKYTEKAEKEVIYGKGKYPHSVQSGNVSVEGEITLLQSEYEALVASSPNKSVLSINVDGVVSYGNPSAGDPLITDRVVGISFTEASKEFKQGDKMMEITLPFIALMVKNQA